METKKIVIFGTGSFAEVAYYYLTHDSKFEVVAFTANESNNKEKRLFNLPIVPFEKIETIYPPSKFSFFIAVGYTTMNEVRSKIYTEVKNKGYHMITYINSKATKWDDLQIGENCFVFENNVIQPFVRIGNDVIIWSGNHIGHHSAIDDHCFITSHVVISGNVKIGHHCFLGVNSTIRDGITIAPKCLIGAGALILENTKDKEVYISKKAKLLPVSSDKLKHI